jgi:hypothetical protein
LMYGSRMTLQSLQQNYWTDLKYPSNDGRQAISDIWTTRSVLNRRSRRYAKSVD